jgi:guanylate kinase
MSLTKRGAMIILSSPSGAGKTTLVKLISEKKNFFTSISHTTRTPRLNEINGVDYFFINEIEFQKLSHDDKFLVHAKVFNNLYGTTKKNVIDKLNQGKNVIFDIDWQGTNQIIQSNLNYKLITIFIIPPSKTVLQERLSNRHKKDKSIVEERIKQFDDDLLHWKDYDYVVVNDELQTCYNNIIKILEAELNNLKYVYDKDSMEKHIKKLI